MHCAVSELDRAVSFDNVTPTVKIFVTVTAIGAPMKPIPNGSLSPTPQFHCTQDILVDLRAVDKQNIQTYGKRGAYDEYERRYPDESCRRTLVLVL
jgi:hypothetical protein